MQTSVPARCGVSICFGLTNIIPRTVSALRRSWTETTTAAEMGPIEATSRHREADGKPMSHEESWRFSVGEAACRAHVHLAVRS
jgi:hypothetical protein